LKDQIQNSKLMTAENNTSALSQFRVEMVCALRKILTCGSGQYRPFARLQKCQDSDRDRD